MFFLCVIGGIAVATVSQEKATQLGKSFTWSGAEVGGNADFAAYLPIPVVLI